MPVMRKDLKAALELAEVYRSGQQNACNQLDAMRQRAEAAENALEVLKGEYAERTGEMMGYSASAAVAQQRVRDLEKALAESRKDSERLDWLEKQRAGVFPGMPKEKHNYWFVRRYDNREEPQPMALLRAAIDAAKEGK